MSRAVQRTLPSFFTYLTDRNFFVLFILTPYYTFFLGSVVSTALDGKEFIMDEFTNKLIQNAIEKNGIDKDVLNIAAAGGNMTAMLIKAGEALKEAVKEKVTKFANPFPQDEDWKNKQAILFDLLTEMTKRIEDFE